MKESTINKIELIIATIFKRIGLNEPLVLIEYRADKGRYCYIIEDGKYFAKGFVSKNDFEAHWRKCIIDIVRNYTDTILNEELILKK